MRDVLHRTSVRGPAFLLAAALLATACGSGDPEASRTPRPSPTPEAITLGGDGDEGSSPAPRATPARGDEDVAVPPGAADPAEPEEAVTAFLEAIADEDHEGQLGRSDGPVRALMRIRDIIRQHGARGDATTQERVEVAEGPRTTELTADRATVALRSMVESVVRTPDDTIRSEARIDGPVVLERRDDGWVLTDFVYSGRPLGPRYAVIDRAETEEGIRLEVDVLLSYKETTAAIVRLVNTGEGKVDVSIAKAVLEGPDGGRAEPEQLAVGDGAAPPIFIGFPRSEDRPRGLEVTLESSAGRSWTYRIPLD